MNQRIRTGLFGSLCFCLLLTGVSFAEDQTNFARQVLEMAEINSAKLNQGVFEVDLVGIEKDKYVIEFYHGVDQIYSGTGGETVSFKFEKEEDQYIEWVVRGASGVLYKHSFIWDEENQELVESASGRIDSLAPTNLRKESDADLKIDDSKENRKVILYLDNTRVVVGRDGGTHKINVLRDPLKMVDGHAVVPIRGVLDELGAHLEYHGDLDMVAIQNRFHSVFLFVGKDTAIVNGKVEPVSLSAVRDQGRIYIPLRFVAEALGYTILYDEDKKEITILKN
ncbi:MAG: copper amine oxidase N-terminal domain-containing protein [Bacillaceae bacterium]|nr:copper amine oxidase N-terminal domain-containing protein [Bacillaceae bacterium]